MFSKDSNNSADNVCFDAAVLKTSAEAEELALKIDGRVIPINDYDWDDENTPCYAAEGE